MKEKDRKITQLLSLTVFTLFALCVLAVLLTGGRIYRDLVNRGSESYRQRTAAQYIATRVRQAEQVGVEEFDGEAVLVIRETVGERTYLTRIYCHEGWLRELYSAESAQLTRSDGEKVLELESLSFFLEDGLLTAQVESRVLRLHLRGGEAVTP